MPDQQIEYPLDQSKDICRFPFPDISNRTSRNMFYGKMEVLAINWALNKNAGAKLELLEESSALYWCQGGREDSPWY